MDEELKEIEERIRKRGKKWKARKTSISELSPEERRDRLGSLRKDEEQKKPRTQTRKEDSDGTTE